MTNVLSYTLCFAIIVAEFVGNLQTFAQAMSNSVAEQKIKPYTAVPGGYLIVLREGEKLFDALERLAVDEQVPSANFTGMGFVNVTFGFFDANKKEYKPGEFRNVELASMHGSIAWKEGKPSVHAHGVVGDQNFESRAGHILNATVSTGSLEILVTVHDKKLERKKDERLGADVLNIY